MTKQLCGPKLTRQVNPDVRAQRDAGIAARPFQVAVRDLRSRLMTLRAVASHGAPGCSQIAKELLDDIVRTRQALGDHLEGLSDEVRGHPSLLDIDHALVEMASEVHRFVTD